MTGSAARIGVLVPSGSVVHEREFAQLATPGVEFQFAGFPFVAAGSGNYCDDVVAHMRAPLAALSAWGADLILIGCTTATMLCAGESFDRRLARIAGMPVVTAAGASRAACTALGARRLAVATPYGEQNNRIVSDYLASQGLSLASIVGLDLDRSAEVWRAAAPTLTAQRVFELACEADRPDADALYLPCTGMASLEAIDRFECAQQKSAFSSVQAGYWASLRELGIDGRQVGRGRLLERWDL